MDDSVHGANMDSESEEEGIPSGHMEAQSTDGNYSTLRNTDQNFDEQSVSDEEENEAEVRSMEDINERVGGRGDANMQDMEEEEEMDYTSGNEDQGNVTGTSFAGEGEMFYSCHEDFHQGRDFLDGDAMGKAGPHSPEGPPPDSTSASPGTADSGSDAGDFDYATPSANEASRGLERRRSEHEEIDEEDDAGRERETPLSPISTAEDSVEESEQFDSQESDARVNPDLQENEATSDTKQMEDRASSSSSSSDEDVTEFSEESRKSQTHVPYHGQEESSEELRTGDEIYSTHHDDNEPDNEPEFGEGEHSISEGIGEDIKASEDVQSSEDREDQNDVETDNTRERTEDDESANQETNEYSETTQVEHPDVTNHHKDNNEEEEDDRLDLTVSSEQALDVRDDERAEAAVVEVHHIDDHGDELDFEEDVEDHAQQYQETTEEQAEEETKEDKESDHVKESVEEDKKDEGVLSGDGEIDDDDDEEEGELDVSTSCIQFYPFFKSVL